MDTHNGYTQSILPSIIWENGILLPLYTRKETQKLMFWGEHCGTMIWNYFFYVSDTIIFLHLICKVYALFSLVCPPIYSHWLSLLPISRPCETRASGLRLNSLNNCNLLSLHGNHLITGVFLLKSWSEQAPGKVKSWSKNKPYPTWIISRMVHILVGCLTSACLSNTHRWHIR